MDDQVINTREDLELMLINEAAKPKPMLFSLLEDITNGFSEENIIGRGGSAVVYKGSVGNRTVAVKKLSIPHEREKEFNGEIQCLMKVKHENIVRFLGYCSDAQGRMASYNGKLVMADVLERLLCFEYLYRGSLDKHITDATCGLEWKQRYQIIVGVCEGLHRLHKDRIFHLDLKPGNILLGDNMLPKIADFGLARCLDKDQTKVHTQNIGGTWGYIAPELHTFDGVITVKSITIKSDLYSLGVIIMEILTGDKGSDRFENWINRLGEPPSPAQLDQIKVCTHIGIECSDINPANRPANTMDIINRFGNARNTQLTNDTDEHVAFKLSTTESVDWSEHFMARLPIFGVVTARSTYTLVLTVSECDVPDKRICVMTLQSCVSHHIRKFRDKHEYEGFFKDNNKAGNEVHEVKLTAFLSVKAPSTSSESTGPGVRILSMEKPWKTLYSVDAHPNNPWIITGHACGHVRIWNHETFC
ncbi:unnamed protein product [Triticum turgidum subsp. durum]|uniref:non-specific serine/threonine protein kinase n=1 Tax=Triticum turgidum subsp. durum TaxID=4567 RepID=A0A9R0SR61_TRITD|nr:unnamed protein product [Triticum turgidum subsp. durum]